MAGRDLAFGAIAGICDTMATRARWERLPAGERYPLPPRELVETSAPSARRPHPGVQPGGGSP